MRSVRLDHLLDSLEAQGVDLTRARRFINSGPWRCLLQDCTVRWNPRLRVTAGRARWAHGAPQIQLNPKLELEGPTATARTLIHEVAHLIARHQGHTPHWALTMIAMGERPEPCHNYASMAAARTPLKLVARCTRCGTEVRRRRRLARNGRAWHHNRCGGELELL